MNAALLLTIDGTLYSLTCRRRIFNVQKHGTKLVYTVQQWAGAWKCNCPAFTYRKRCKHEDSLRQLGLIHEDYARD